VEGNAVPLAQFLRAIFEEPDEGPIDVAEAEEAEVKGADGILLDGVQIDSAN
jgi:hypothetical protein